MTVLLFVSFRVWSVKTNEMLNTLIHHCEAVLHLRFADGIMVTCSKVIVSEYIMTVNIAPVVADFIFKSIDTSLKTLQTLCCIWTVELVVLMVTDLWYQG